jgi:hypothetical protein
LIRWSNNPTNDVDKPAITFEKKNPEPFAKSIFRPV